MPIYRCFSPQGLVTTSAKARIARQITKIHCDATGAPPSFVNVVFHEITEGDCFVAGEITTRSYLTGVIRHGRSLETRQSMLRALSGMWAQVTGRSEAELIVTLTEIDPANSVEGGLIVPEPGLEQEWLDQNHATLNQKA